MAVPNLSEIASTTIDHRSGEVADNIQKNNPALAYMEKNGNIKTADGGDTLVEELSFAENGNAAWYSGMDALPVQQIDTVSAAQYNWKQLAAAVVISGLDKRKNRGEEKIIDLLDARMEVAEGTLRNFVEEGIFSDGTTYGGKTITGFDAMIPTTPTTGTYGGISRDSYSFWQSQLQSDSGAPSSTTIQGRMNTLYAKCVRGADHPDLIILSQSYWAAFLASLQTLQRFVDTKKADLGFASQAYLGADVVLGGGIGGFATDTLGTGYFLNTKYMALKVHPEMRFNSLDPEKRFSMHQDAMVVLIGWMGNLTCRGARFQGRLVHS